MENGLSRLHQFIVDHYNLEELRTLCFDLGVDYDELGGEGKSAKANREVIMPGRAQEFASLPRLPNSETRRE